ncbi:MAG: hypothetical protein F6K10_09150 [Moorea sp. SIO2B7]|nr:hypothetical protein [Moorena sp. SIO2B7]
MADISKEQMRERLGNIEQIRDLLFGYKIKQYEEIFAKYDQRLGNLESELSNFQSEIRDRLTQLQDSLSTEMGSEIDSLEKKLKYLSLTTHEEMSKLQQQIKITDEKNSHNIDSLNNTVMSKNNFFKNELFQTRDKLEEDVQFLRKQVFEYLEKSLSHLKDEKISRADLAQVLFEVCLKVKGTDFVPDLKEAVDNQVKSDFLLPEQNKEEPND